MSFSRLNIPIGDDSVVFYYKPEPGSLWFVANGSIGSMLEWGGKAAHRWSNYTKNIPSDVIQQGPPALINLAGLFILLPKLVDVISLPVLSWVPLTRPPRKCFELKLTINFIIQFYINHIIYLPK